MYYKKYNNQRYATDKVTIETKKNISYLSNNQPVIRRFAIHTATKQRSNELTTETPDVIEVSR